MKKTKLEFYFKKVRSDFPILNQKVHKNKLIYADNSATTQKPKQVIKVVTDFYSKYNSNVHRGVHTLAQKSTEEYENAREKISKFVNCEKNEVIFTKGTTDSINMIAFGLMDEIKKGDEIVLSVSEHHANLVCWQEVAKRCGAKLRFIPLTKDFDLDLKQAEKIINKKTKVVAVSHISNVLGTINPIERINKLARKYNVITVFDVAQSILHKKMDFKKLDADFICFSGHKMLAPTGIGCLIGKLKSLERLKPLEYGGDMIYEVELEKSSYTKLPLRLESGTPNIEGAIGLGAAIDYINKIGIENIEEYEKELTQYFLEKLKEVPNLKLYGKYTHEKRVPVFSFNIGKVHSHDVSEILDKQGIATRGGHHCAMPLAELIGVSSTSRISLSFYNTKDEIDKIIKALKTVEPAYQKGDFLLR